MHCPQCAIAITDPEAIFCPRCGILLQAKVTQSNLGWAPVSGTPADPVSTGSGRPVTRSIENSRVLKVAVSALVGAAFLTWCTWVTNYLQALPAKSQAVYRAMQDPHNVEDLQGFGNELGRDSLNAALPFGIVGGLVLGVGLGWLLTHPLLIVRSSQSE